MNIEQQVCSLDLAKQLKELRVKQESCFIWVVEGLPSRSFVSDRKHGYVGACAAFTVAELGEMLPYNIDLGESITYFFGVRKGDDGKWATFYGNGLGFWRLTFSWYDTEADARSHPGKDHQWKVQRLRGQCPNRETKYVPDTPLPKPVNAVIGRGLYKRR
jgi:hypothetical protein